MGECTKTIGGYERPDGYNLTQIESYDIDFRYKKRDHNIQSKSHKKLLLINIL